MRKITLFILLLIGFPIILALLLNVPVFKYASGQLDSWIMFWGSYIGAVIGASVVYFVARFQIQKQHDQQISSIKLESKHSISREMEHFLITTRLGKYEKIIKVCDSIGKIQTEISNDFVRYITYMDIINNKEDPDREKEFKDKIYEIKTKHYEYHSLILLNTTELRTLTNYSPDIKEDCGELSWKLNDLWLEARECYYSKNKYKQYFKPDERILLNNAELIIDIVSKLIEEMNIKISSELTEIERRIAVHSN